MQNLYEKILEKWFYSNNEKVVRLNDIKEIFETAKESVPAEKLVMPKIAEIAKILIEQMKPLTDEQRKEIIDEITNEYCYYCGGKYMPCYCRRDD